MTRTKKKSGRPGVLISGILVLAAALVVLNALSTFLAAKVIETAVGQPVSIEKFKLDLFSSQAALYGLRIRNPKGFKEKTLASIPEISLHVDVPALLQNRVHIWEIRLNLDEIVVERLETGAINLTEIGAVKNARRRPAPGRREAPSPGEPSPSPGRSQPSAKPAKPPQVLIDTVVLSLGRARYVDPVMGEKTMALEIKDFVLKNVTDPVQITQQIVVKVLERVGLGAVTEQLKQFGIDWDWQAAGAADELKQAWAGFRDKFKF